MLLTDRGREALEAAAPAHASEERELFFGGLWAQDVDRLGEISGKILARLEVGCTAAAPTDDDCATPPAEDCAAPEDDCARGA